MKMSAGLKIAIKARLAKQPNGPMQPTVVTYLGKSYVLSQCDGDAHSADVGGMVDNCMQCAPLWGVRVEMLDEHVDSYVGWLESTLVADLHESGMHATAEDFEHCITLIRALQGGAR